MDSEVLVGNKEAVRDKFSTSVIASSIVHASVVSYPLIYSFNTTCSCVQDVIYSWKATGYSWKGQGELDIE